MGYPRGSRIHIKPSKMRECACFYGGYRGVTLTSRKWNIQKIFKNIPKSTGFQRKSWVIKGNHIQMGNNEKCMGMCGFMRIYRGVTLTSRKIEYP